MNFTLLKIARRPFERYKFFLKRVVILTIKGESVETEVDKNEESKLMVAADLLSELGWSR